MPFEPYISTKENIPKITVSETGLTISSYLRKALPHHVCLFVDRAARIVKLSPANGLYPFLSINPNGYLGGRSPALMYFLGLSRRAVIYMKTEGDSWIGDLPTNQANDP